MWSALWLTSWCENGKCGETNVATRTLTLQFQTNKIEGFSTLTLHLYWRQFGQWIWFFLQCKREKKQYLWVPSTFHSLHLSWILQQAPDPLTSFILLFWCSLSPSPCSIHFCYKGAGQAAALSVPHPRNIRPWLLLLLFFLHSRSVLSVCLPLLSSRSPWLKIPQGCKTLALLSVARDKRGRKKSRDEERKQRLCLLISCALMWVITYLMKTGMHTWGKRTHTHSHTQRHTHTHTHTHTDKYSCICTYRHRWFGS